jgi:hypothetical protein
MDGDLLMLRFLPTRIKDSIMNRKATVSSSSVVFFHSCLFGDRMISHLRIRPRSLTLNAHRDLSVAAATA